MRRFIDGGQWHPNVRRYEALGQAQRASITKLDFPWVGKVSLAGFLAYVDDDVLGLIGPLRAEGGRLRAPYVGVRADRRRQGIGTALWQSAFTLTSGVVELTAEAINRPFYESLGFERVVLGSDRQLVTRRLHSLLARHDHGVGSLGAT